MAPLPVLVSNRWNRNATVADVARGKWELSAQFSYGAGVHEKLPLRSTRNRLLGTQSNQEPATPPQAIALELPVEQGEAGRGRSDA